MKSLIFSALLLLAAAFPASALAQNSFTTTAQALVQQNPSVDGVWIDPATLGLSADAAPTFQSVAVHPAEPANAPAVPARLDRIDSGYRVLWEIPRAAKGTKPGKAESFNIQLNAPSPSPALSANQANLLFNGDFERLNNQGIPAGYNPRTFPHQYRLEQDGGNHFLAFNADAKGQGSLWTPPVAVQPGKSYTVSFRYHIRGAKPHPRYNLNFYSWIYFFNADQKRLTPSRVAAAKSMGDTDGWQNFEATVAMPKDAHFVRLQLNNANTVPYAVAIDDLRIAPAILPEITKITTAQGRTISLVAQSPEIRRYDLGPADSPVWKGYTPLTPQDKYSKQKGFGFLRLAGGSKGVDRTRPNALLRDLIQARTAQLRVDLPRGKYHVWILSGDPQVGSTIEWLYFDQSLSINGKRIFEDNTKPAEFFGKNGQYWRHYKDFWTPGMDYYDTFIAPRFKTFSHEAEVGKDHLQIEWKNMPVNAIVIAPADQAEAMTREMHALQGQLRRATQVVQTPDPEEPMPRLSDADQQRGFVLFRRPANETIYPSSRPQPGEEIDHLQTFAAPGQGQSVHFSLLPVKDMGQISVQAGNLSDGSSTIPASAIDVRVSRYIFHAATNVRYVQAAYNYQIAPFTLDHHKSVPGNKGLTWSWWATIRVPENTAPGVYAGSLKITPEHGQAFDLPLRVRVLPFKLAPLPIVQGFYYFPTEPWYSTFWRANVIGPTYRDDPAVRQIIAREVMDNLAFMKDIGLNSVAFGDDLRGDIEYKDGELSLKKDNRFTFWMDLYAKAGMGPMPFYGFQPYGMANRLGSWFPKELKQPFTPQWIKAYRSFVTNVQAMGKQRGWPQIIWYISDEASNHGQQGAELARRCADLLHNLPGVTTISSMNGPPEHILPPHLDISMPNIAYPITAQTIKMIRDAGSRLWLYNCGDTRLMLGLYPWRLDAGGRFQWHYRYIQADPWDDLDGGGGDSKYSITLPSPDGPVPTIESEATRAAINDHRYVATLEQAIAAAKDHPEKKDLAEQAQNFLNDLRRRIPIDARTLVGYRVDPRAAGAAVGGEFKNTDALDRVRWAVAEYILKLQEQAAQ